MRETKEKERKEMNFLQVAELTGYSDTSFILLIVLLFNFCSENFKSELSMFWSNLSPFLPLQLLSYVSTPLSLPTFMCSFISAHWVFFVLFVQTWASNYLLEHGESLKSHTPVENHLFLSNELSVSNSFSSYHCTYLVCSFVPHLESPVHMEPCFVLSCKNMPC